MNEQIIPLKGADRIRKRPAVVFGSADADGALAVVKTLINVMVREAILGYCTKLSVVLHKDGSISVCSNDRGMKLDETIVDGKPEWQNIFCDFGDPLLELNEISYDILGKAQDTLYGDGNEFPAYPTDADYQFDLCCVQYACEYMTVNSVRDGVKKTAEFQKGSPSSDIRKEPTVERSGTFINFKIDTDVFSSIEISFNALARYLQILAITVKGLACDLYVESEEQSFSYQYENGIGDYASAHNCYIKEKEAVGRDRYNKPEYKAHVKIAVGFDEKAPRCECFHNYRELNGGAHLEAVRSKIRDYFDWFLLGKSANPEASEKMINNLMDSLVVIIESNCSQNSTVWTNGACNAIANTMIADIASDLIDGDFIYFLEKVKMPL